MINFVQQIYAWISIHRDAVHMCITGLISIITGLSLIFRFKNTKSIANMQANVTRLAKIVSDYDNISTNLSSMAEIINDHQSLINHSVDKMVTVQDLDTEMLKKLNSVLDVLGLAYSTIKNDEIRLAITNIVNNAKLFEPVKQTVKENQFEEKLKNFLDAVNKVTNSIPTVSATKLDDTVENKDTVEPVQPVQPVIRRY